MTQFSRGYDIEEEDIDFRLSQNAKSINVITSKEPNTEHIPTLIIIERNAHIDS